MPHNAPYEEQSKIKNPVFMRVREIGKFAYDYMPKIWGIHRFSGMGMAISMASVHTYGM